MAGKINWTGTTLATLEIEPIEPHSAWRSNFGIFKMVWQFS